MPGFGAMDLSYSARMPLKTTRPGILVYETSFSLCRRAREKGLALCLKECTRVMYKGLSSLVSRQVLNPEPYMVHRLFRV